MMKLRTLSFAMVLGSVLATQGCVEEPEPAGTSSLATFCTPEICGDVLARTTSAANTVGATFGEAAKTTIDRMAAERWAFSHVRLNPNALACLVLVATAMAESLPGDGKVSTGSYDMDTVLRILSEDSQIRVLSDDTTTDATLERTYTDTHDALKSPDALAIYAPMSAKQTQAFIDQVNVADGVTKIKAWALTAASAIAAKIPNVQLPKGPDLGVMKAQAMALLKEGLRAVAAWSKRQLPSTVQVGRDVTVPPVDAMVELCARDPRGCQCAAMECLPENPPPDVPQGLPYLYASLDGYIQHAGPLTKIKLADYIDPYFEKRDLVVLIASSTLCGRNNEAYFQTIHQVNDSRIQWLYVVEGKAYDGTPATLDDLNEGRLLLDRTQAAVAPRLVWFDVALDPQFASLGAGGLPGSPRTCPRTIVFNARTMKPLTNSEGRPLDGVLELQRNIAEWRTALRANL